MKKDENILFEPEGPDKMTDGEREFMEFLNAVSPEEPDPEDEPMQQPKPTIPRAKARLRINMKGSSHDNLSTRKGDNAT